MKRRSRPMLRAAAIAAALLAPVAGTRASDPVSIPSAAGDVEGNSDNLYPFNGNPMRYQQVVAASEFPAGARTITRIALRADAASGAAFNESLGHVRINLSTSPSTPSTLSPTFAENVGQDDATVFDGRLRISSAFTGPDAGPKDFDIIIALDAPFTYNPASGSLLLDVRNFSGGKSTQLDAHDAPGSTARVWSDDVNAETAKPGDLFPSVGLVVRFLSD